MAGGSGPGLMLMGSCRKAKETGLQPCCCAIFVQSNNRNSAVNKNRQAKNFPSLSVSTHFFPDEELSHSRRVNSLCLLLGNWDNNTGSERRDYGVVTRATATHCTLGAKNAFFKANNSRALRGSS